MDAVIITCARRGTASRCIPSIVEAGVCLKAVIVAHGAGTNASRAFFRKIRKVLKIGILGAVIGVRMRRWFESPTEDVEALCLRYGVPFKTIEGLNSVEMEAYLKQLNPTIGVSLGNGYIAPRIFSIPKLGMINLHTEVLPAYQNARAIIWPIYKNDPYTGYTIHEIERGIDEGRILLQRRYPIKFARSLSETVKITKAITDESFPKDVANVIANIREMKNNAQKQDVGGKYTTPTFWQYLRMVINNRRFYRIQEQKGML